MSVSEMANALLWLSVSWSGVLKAPMIQSRSTNVIAVLVRSLSMTFPPRCSSFQAATAAWLS
jgi:hypothetical protein